MSPLCRIFTFTSIKPAEKYIRRDFSSPRRVFGRNAPRERFPDDARGAHSHAKKSRDVCAILSESCYFVPVYSRVQLHRDCDLHCPAVVEQKKCFERDFASRYYIALLYGKYRFCYKKKESKNALFFTCDIALAIMMRLTWLVFAARNRY